MKNEFGKIYSELYDIFYQDKHYEKECTILRRIFTKFKKNKVKTILDLGCGTGNYAIPLTKKGYSVTGIDISEYMLREARKKVPHKGNVKFIAGDIKTFKIDKKFDAAIMMFAVLGYQRKNGEVEKTLKNVRSHLKPGGLFVFDVWYGPTVLTQKPTLRIKSFPLRNGGKVVRIASGELSTEKHTCNVHYQVQIIGRNNMYSEYKENHTMRYFFPMELKYYLSKTGFKLHTIRSFPQYSSRIDDTNWNIIAVAKAI